MPLELSFQFSERAKDLHRRVLAFAHEHVAPAEPTFHALAEREPASTTPADRGAEEEGVGSGVVSDRSAGAEEVPGLRSSREPGSEACSKH
jgi:hypothetical protein